jgi:hypothetical protein
VTKRKAPIVLKRGSRLARPLSRQNINEIVVQRDRLIALVKALRGNHASKLTENAQQLLTRWWCTANWSARRDLLKSAEWLVRLEKNRRGMDDFQPLGDSRY